MSQKTFCFAQKKVKGDRSFMLRVPGGKRKSDDFCSGEEEVVTGLGELNEIAAAADEEVAALCLTQSAFW